MFMDNNINRLRIILSNPNRLVAHLIKFDFHDFEMNLLDK